MILRMQVISRSLLCSGASLRRSTRPPLPRSQGSFDRALAYLDAADAQEPDNAATLRVRGEILHMLGRIDDALSDLSSADALQPRHAWTLRVRGDVLLAKGLLEAALYDFDAGARPPHVDSHSESPILCLPFCVQLPTVHFFFHLRS